MSGMLGMRCLDHKMHMADKIFNKALPSYGGLVVLFSYGSAVPVTRTNDIEHWNAVITFLFTYEIGQEAVLVLYNSCCLYQHVKYMHIL